MNRAAATALAAVLALGGSACSQARQIDGTANGVAACTGCHGDAARAEDVALVQAAPPLTPSGAADGGAHQAHLHANAFRDAVACDACHVVPQVVTHSDGVVSVTFPGLAPVPGVTPAWNPGNGTCSGISCHGAGVQGAPATTPAWTSTAALGCGSCHGNPPASHAAGSTDCSGCHPGTVNPDGTIYVANGLHIDGQVQANSAHADGWADPAQHGYTANRTGLASCKRCHGSTLAGDLGRACSDCHGAGWDTSCTFCHGTAGRQSGPAAPPVDTQGRNVATNVSVGVHVSHVTTTLSTPLACGECHPARTTSVISDAAHVDGDGIAEVVLGTLARTLGAPAAYSRASATSASCSSVYCHGRFAGGANGGAGATMSWTSGTVGCSSCHPSSPTTGEHQRHISRFPCSECHGAGYSSSTVNAAAHVNGTKNVPLPGPTGTLSGASWNGTSCGTFSCHSKSHGSGDTW